MPDRPFLSTSPSTVLSQELRPIPENLENTGLPHSGGLNLLMRNFGFSVWNFRYETRLEISDLEVCICNLRHVNYMISAGSYCMSNGSGQSVDVFLSI